MVACSVLENSVDLKAAYSAFQMVVCSVLKSAENSVDLKAARLAF